jgi:hypothetical protein
MNVATLLLFFSLPLWGAQPQVDFSGSWQQDASRSVPEVKAGRSRELDIQLTATTLTYKLITKSSQGPRTQAFKFEIGGPEIVYTGLDGDEFHTKVRWDGEALVFDTVEHERGSEILSKQVWTVTDGGKSLREVRQTMKSGKPVESVAVYEKR